MIFLKKLKIKIEQIYFMFIINKVLLFNFYIFYYYFYSFLFSFLIWLKILPKRHDLGLYVRFLYLLKNLKEVKRGLSWV